MCIRDRISTTLKGASAVITSSYGQTLNNMSTMSTLAQTTMHISTTTDVRTTEEQLTFGNTLTRKSTTKKEINEGEQSTYVQTTNEEIDKPTTFRLTTPKGISQTHSPTGQTTSMISTNVHGTTSEEKFTFGPTTNTISTKAEGTTSIMTTNKSETMQPYRLMKMSTTKTS